MLISVHQFKTINPAKIKIEHDNGYNVNSAIHSVFIIHISIVLHVDVRWAGNLPSRQVAYPADELA